jgi:hypothetical protein
MSSSHTAAVTMCANGNKTITTVHTPSSPLSTHRVYTKDDIDHLAAIYDQETVDSKCSRPVAALVKPSCIGWNVIIHIMTGIRRAGTGRLANLTNVRTNDIESYRSMHADTRMPKAVALGKPEGDIRSTLYPVETQSPSAGRKSSPHLPFSYSSWAEPHCQYSTRRRRKCGTTYLVFEARWVELGDHVMHDFGRHIIIDKTSSSLDHQSTSHSVRVHSIH